jgi:PIN domain nuclease of toxin-antitoxin system
MRAVLDASALLAFLRDEPGAPVVEAELSAAVISSVNWAEVIQKSLAVGVPIEGLANDLSAYGLTILPFTADDAHRAGELWLQTRALGLSLGDRACLATAARLNLPALTTDRSWAMLDLGIPVRVIR